MDSAELVQFYYEQINKIRKSPRSIEHLLHDRLARLIKEDNKFQTAQCFSHYQFGNVLFTTIQGDKAIRQAIKYIQQQSKVPAVVLSQKLCQVAYQVGLQIQKTLPKQIDITAFKQIIKKEVKKQIPHIHERIQAIVEYGFRKDLDLLTSIIIDDGDYQRSKRNILMNDSFKTVGISVHEHNQFDYFVLFLFSTYEEPASCQCQII